MVKLGLTGGIASGKSTVAGMLRKIGFEVLDADSLGHQLMEPGTPGYEDVVREFGSSIVDASGRIDRKKLGAIVFADRTKLERLNAIVHPLVKEGMKRQLEEWSKEKGKKAAFVEAALLVEAGYEDALDGLVVAWSRPEQQMERLRERGMSEEEARSRMEAQLPVEEKLGHATHTIDCSGTLEETWRQVEALAVQLQEGKYRGAG